MSAGPHNGDPWAPRPDYRRTSWRTHSPQGVPAPSEPGAAGPLGPAGSPVAPRRAVAANGSVPDWARSHAQRRRRRGDIARFVLATLGGLGLIAVMAAVYISTDGSTPQMLVAAVLAFLPLGLVLVAVRWIDRWEPEPISVQVAAFLWGAGVATVVSMIVNTTASRVAFEATGSENDAALFSAVVSAPIIEETTKGLGVLIIFLIWRRSFNGAVDGIVYASVVAAGFAFAENILYFVQYADSLAETFFLRGIASPFAHVTFTASTGLAIGSSARRRSPLAWLWLAPLGLTGAIILHAFWNGVVAAMPEFYFVVEVPFFLACVGLVLWLRWSERMTMRTRLSEYARAGWFDPAEVTMLTTNSGRAAARRWAWLRGPRAAEAMHEFQRAAAALAQLRQQAVDGHADADYGTTQAQLLRTVADCRATFLGTRR